MHVENEKSKCRVEYALVYLAAKYGGSVSGGLPHTCQIFGDEHKPTAEFGGTHNPILKMSTRKPTTVLRCASGVKIYSDTPALSVVPMVRDVAIITGMPT
jgi:hypothetical protein